MIDAGFGPLAADCFGGEEMGRALLVRCDGTAGAEPGRLSRLRSGIWTPDSCSQTLTRGRKRSTAVPTFGYGTVLSVARRASSVLPLSTGPGACGRVL
jgi:hypothetical protein